MCVCALVHVFVWGEGMWCVCRCTFLCVIGRAITVVHFLFVSTHFVKNKPWMNRIVRSWAEWIVLSLVCNLCVCIMYVCICVCVHLFACEVCVCAYICVWRVCLLLCVMCAFMLVWMFLLMLCVFMCFHVMCVHVCVCECSSDDVWSNCVCAGNCSVNCTQAGWSGYLCFHQLKRVNVPRQQTCQSTDALTWDLIRKLMYRCLFCVVVL